MSLASGCGMQFPRYRCHKEVWALKIKEVRRVQEPSFDKPICKGDTTLRTACGKCERCKWREEHGDLALVLVPEDERYARFCVSAEYAAKHKPEAGGYYVLYKDGYVSFSPASAFEESYTQI